MITIALLTILIVYILDKVGIELPSFLIKLNNKSNALIRKIRDFIQKLRS